MYTKEQAKIDVAIIKLWEKDYRRHNPEATDEEVQHAKRKYFQTLAQKIWVEMHT